MFYTLYSYFFITIFLNKRVKKNNFETLWNLNRENKCNTVYKHR